MPFIFRAKGLLPLAGGKTPDMGSERGAEVQRLPAAGAGPQLPPQIHNPQKAQHFWTGVGWGGRVFPWLAPWPYRVKDLLESLREIKSFVHAGPGGWGWPQGPHVEELQSRLIA